MNAWKGCGQWPLYLQIWLCFCFGYATQKFSPLFLSTWLVYWTSKSILFLFGLYTWEVHSTILVMDIDPIYSVGPVNFKLFGNTVLAALLVAFFTRLVHCIFLMHIEVNCSRDVRYEFFHPFGIQTNITWHKEPHI